jgi:L-ascorbate metabolism protein UlaG (beta-lactamase superfamily)
MKFQDIELKWLGHSSFFIKNSKTVYIDPYNISAGEKADIILITHAHYDHCSIPDIEKIVKQGTIIILPADGQSKITKLKEKIEMILAEPNQEIKLGKIKIDTFPAYNSSKKFHPKSENLMGYLIKINNTIVYHAGDTDLIPEMEKLTGYGKQGNNFIALLPVGGNFTMDAVEAARAASTIKPSLAIPMHYSSIVGNQVDAEKFVELCKESGIESQILGKE